MSDEWKVVSYKKRCKKNIEHPSMANKYKVVKCQITPSTSLGLLKNCPRIPSVKGNFKDVAHKNNTLLHTALDLLNWRNSVCKKAGDRSQSYHLTSSSIHRYKVQLVSSVYPHVLYVQYNMHYENNMLQYSRFRHVYVKFDIDRC